MTTDKTNDARGASRLHAELEAKPCPFCGEKSITIREGSTFRWMLAECLECGATCGEVRVQTMGPGLPADWKAKAEQDVVAEWNKRASNVKVSGAGTASAGLPGYAGDNNGE